MPRISQGELDEYRRLRSESVDNALTIGGLRTSLEAALRGEDGMVPVFKTAPTPEGLRHTSLRWALEHNARRKEPLEDPDAVVADAATFEAYLRGAPGPARKAIPLVEQAPEGGIAPSAVEDVRADVLGYNE
jgi:hypothetical protein